METGIWLEMAFGKVEFYFQNILNGTDSCLLQWFRIKKWQQHNVLHILAGLDKCKIQHSREKGILLVYFVWTTENSKQILGPFSHWFSDELLRLKTFWLLISPCISWRPTTWQCKLLKPSYIDSGQQSQLSQHFATIFPLTNIFIQIRRSSSCCSDLFITTSPHLQASSEAPPSLLSIPLSPNYLSLRCCWCLVCV